MDILSYSKSIQNKNTITTLQSAGTDVKTVVFVIPRIIHTGVQDFEIQFPFKGTIQSVQATLKNPSTSGNTEVQVEKVSNTSYNASANPTFTAILSSPLTVLANKKGAVSTALSTTSVDLNDVFRLNIGLLGTDANGLTVYVSIKVTL